MGLLSLEAVAGPSTMSKRDGRSKNALKFGGETQAQIAALIDGDYHLRCSGGQ